LEHRQQERKRMSNAVRVVPRITWTDSTGRRHGMTVTTPRGKVPIGGGYEDMEHATVAEHLRAIIGRLREAGCTDVLPVLWPAEYEQKLRGGADFGADELVIEIPEGPPVNRLSADEHAVVGLVLAYRETPNA
jgi:hypothetical protein